MVKQISSDQSSPCPLSLVVHHSKEKGLLDSIHSSTSPTPEGQVVIPSVNKNDEDTIDQTAQDYIKPEEKKEDSTKPIQIDLDSLEDVADPDALVDEIYYRGIYVSDPEDEDLETEGNVLSSILRDRDRASSREARSKGYVRHDEKMRDTLAFFLRAHVPALFKVPKKK
ncbi:uncharacterized protein LOC107304395 [Oryza brachyantha]|uniref:uncharacterized protein LOC107304395 n=1 Tax=Oryza brachyantha TaxID=4533 RepID=UPI00077617CE|nr:uncharacterized protein LOC107304395 [Oryza brachyantha]